MIVCNLLVVVTYVYRVFLSSSDEEFPSGSDPLDDDDFTTPAPRSRSAHDLTTIDLESLHTSITGTRTASELKGDFLPSTAHSTRGSEPGR
jgi:hypothetical protein